MRLMQCSLNNLAKNYQVGSKINKTRSRVIPESSKSHPRVIPELSQMEFSESITEKLYRLFTGRKSIILLTDGFSTCKKCISPGFGVESRDAIASKNMGYSRRKKEKPTPTL